MPIFQLFKNQANSSALIQLAASRQPRQRSKCPAFFSAGFTLVELLIVVAIIGIIVTLVLPIFDDLVGRARSARVKQELRLMEGEINDYLVQNGVLPANLIAINRGTLKDPWGRGYVYSTAPARERFGNILNDDYDLFSMGADGLTPADGVLTGTGADDILRGLNGAFLGLGEDW